MSRYFVKSEIDSKLTIVYGYDNKLDETFVQVITDEPDKTNPGRTADIVVALGNNFCLVKHPKLPEKDKYNNSELLSVIREYGGLILPEHENAMKQEIPF